MRLLATDNGGQVDTQRSIADIGALLERQSGFLWLDLTGGDIENGYESLLTQVFGFHPLAVDDALNEIHVPKLDDWGSYLYLVFQDVAYDQNERVLALPELDVFLGEQYLLTYHLEDITAVNRTWAACQRDTRWLQHGADHLLYHLLDEMANDYAQVIGQIEDEMAQLENNMFTHPTPELLEMLFDYRQIALRLRKALAPQREVINKLSRDTFSMIGPKDQLFYRDVYDHMLRLHDTSESMRDLAMSGLDIYLSVVNNRMNDIMKTLTIITTLFMPLSFLTGFFGMNFFEATMPSSPWTGPAALIVALLSMVAVPAIMFWWMRRRAWM
ncbi:MAG: magnesium/cobalt transporter CorA [Anaerolineales bacterium]|nr:magnesium/cobalt transporter CorA [Anaerolineales bacterium]